MINPRAGFDRLVTIARQPRDQWPPGPLVDALLRAIVGDTSAPASIAYAVELASTIPLRGILDALYTAGATDREVYDATGVPFPTLECYRRCIFDASMFRSRLDRLAYASGLYRDQISQAPEDSQDPELRQMRAARQWALWAVEYGLPFLLLKLNPDAHAPSKAMLNRLRNEAYLRALDGMKQRPGSTQTRAYMAAFGNFHRMAVAEDIGNQDAQTDWEVVLSTPAEFEAGAPATTTIPLGDIQT